MSGLILILVELFFLEIFFSDLVLQIAPWPLLTLLFKVTNCFIFDLL
jgi:hypothetical protein